MCLDATFEQGSGSNHCQHFPLMQHMFYFVLPIVNIVVKEIKQFI